MKTIFIISGDEGTGKSSLIKSITTILQKYNRTILGYRTIYNEPTNCFSIQMLQNDEKFLFTGRWDQFQKKSNHVKFIRKALELENDRVRNLNYKKSLIVTIDEIGCYELEGKVLHNIFTELVQLLLPLIITTKNEYLPAVIRKWNLNPAAVFYQFEFSEPEKIVSQIERMIKLCKEQNL